MYLGLSNKAIKGRRKALLLTGTDFKTQKKSATMREREKKIQVRTSYNYHTLYHDTGCPLRPLPAPGGYPLLGAT